MMLKEVSQKIALKANVGIDPATILVIMEIVKQIMAMFENCNLPNKEKAVLSKKPGPYHKIMLNTAIRRVSDGQLPREEVVKLRNGIVEYGLDVSEETLEVLHDEVKNSII
jgi:hypothetical protein